MKLASILSLATASAVGLLSAPSVLAANLVAPVPGGAATNVFSFSSVSGTGNGVNIQIIGGQAFFTFIPATNNYDGDFATGAFAQFGDEIGTVQGVTLPFPIPPDTQVDIPDIAQFITFDGGAIGNGDDFFDLESVFSPVFNQTQLGTTAEFSGLGTCYNTTSGLNFGCEIQFTASFIGFTAADIIAAASAPGGITRAFAGTMAPAPTPEPASILGLAFVGASALVIRKRKA